MRAKQARRSKKIKRAVIWSLISVVGVIALYALSIVWFEVSLGINQPRDSTSLVLATFNEAGDRHERVLRLERIDGNNYIAANHWPRRWYEQALQNPFVEVDLPGKEGFEPFTAVPLEGKELEKVTELYSFDLEFRLRTGFPPLNYMRLDPRR